MINEIRREVSSVLLHSIGILNFGINLGRAGIWWSFDVNMGGATLRQNFDVNIGKATKLI
jgi:hypothetical protein